jgi:hypothetical protein
MTTRRYRLTGALVGLAMIGANGMVTDGQLAGPSALLSAVRSAQPEDDDFGALAAAALDATADDRARLADILRRGSEAQRTAALFALADAVGTTPLRCWRSILLVRHGDKRVTGVMFTWVS